MPSHNSRRASNGFFIRVARVTTALACPDSWCQSCGLSVLICTYTPDVRSGLWGLIFLQISAGWFEPRLSNFESPTRGSFIWTRFSLMVTGQDCCLSNQTSIYRQFESVDTLKINNLDNESISIINHLFFSNSPSNLIIGQKIKPMNSTSHSSVSSALVFYFKAEHRLLFPRGYLLIPRIA